MKGQEERRKSWEASDEARGLDSTKFLGAERGGDGERRVYVTKGEGGNKTKKVCDSVKQMILREKKKSQICD